MKKPYLAPIFVSVSITAVNLSLSFFTVLYQIKPEKSLLYYNIASIICLNEGSVFVDEPEVYRYSPTTLDLINTILFELPSRWLADLFTADILLLNPDKSLGNAGYLITIDHGCIIDKRGILYWWFVIVPFDCTSFNTCAIILKVWILDIQTAWVRKGWGGVATE